MPPAGYFLSSAKESNQRTPPKPRFWIPKRAPHIGKLFWCVPHVWKILQGALNVGAETILNLGHVLLKPYLPTGKEVKKPSGFLRIFGYFLCAQKVPRRRHGHADFTTDPVKTQKNRRSKNAAAAGIRCNALDYAPPGRVSQVITCTGFSRWVVSSMLLRFQLPAAYGSREACDPHTDPTSPITKCEDKKGLSRTAQGAGTASAALTDIV